MYFSKIFLVIIFVLFNFQSLTKADDIRDLEIEGISVGDSLLGFFDKNEIDNKIVTPWKDKKTYHSFYTNNNLKEYDSIAFAYLIKDKKYKVDEISGRKFMNYEKCKKKIYEVSSDVEVLFASANKDDRGEYNHRIDRSKKSKVRTINYLLNDGSIVHIACYKWSKKLKNEKGYMDSLMIAIASEKFVEWQKNKAYK